MTAPHQNGRRSDDATIGDLVAALADDAALRLRQEVELASAEAREELMRTARANRTVGAAVYVAHVAVLLLSFALAWGLAVPLGPGPAFLVVGLVYVSVAGLLMLVGREPPRSADKTVARDRRRDTRAADAMAPGADGDEDGEDSDEEARWGADPTR